MGELKPDVQALTDAEWREFQSIPEQGYSHRHWVDYKIQGRVDAHAATMPDREAVADLLDDRQWERGNVISEWPEDEAEAYREFGWREGVEAARRILHLKQADAVLALLNKEGEE